MGYHYISPHMRIPFWNAISFVFAIAMSFFNNKVKPALAEKEEQTGGV